MKLKVLRGFFDVIGPVLITKPNQPFPVLGDADYFFGKTFSKISSTTWIMLLLRSGDRAIISERAARPIAIIAVVMGSIEVRRFATSLVLFNDGIQALGALR